MFLKSTDDDEYQQLLDNQNNARTKRNFSIASFTVVVMVLLLCQVSWTSPSSLRETAVGVGECGFYKLTHKDTGKQIWIMPSQHAGIPYGPKFLELVANVVK